MNFFLRRTHITIIILTTHLIAYTNSFAPFTTTFRAEQSYGKNSHEITRRHLMEASDFVNVIELSTLLVTMPIAANVYFKYKEREKELEEEKMFDEAFLMRLKAAENREAER
mmetsp:Transcript_12298/g.18456  ORF Transcript_12298/g.18456 Transcript_12298/m.18456 type:complete len:112 (-) Transcript_12298:378-713(-)